MWDRGTKAYKQTKLKECRTMEKMKHKNNNIKFETAPAAATLIILTHKFHSQCVFLPREDATKKSTKIRENEVAHNIAKYVKSKSKVNNTELGSSVAGRESDAEKQHTYLRDSRVAVESTNQVKHNRLSSQNRETE